MATNSVERLLRAGLGREVPRDRGQTRKDLEVEVVVSRVGQRLLLLQRPQRFACPSTSLDSLHSTHPCRGMASFDASVNRHPDPPPAHGGDSGISSPRHPGCPCPGESAGTSGICLKPQALFSNERETPFVLYASLRSPSTLPVALYGRQL